MNRILPQEDADELYRIYPDLPHTHLLGCPSCGKNNGQGVDGTLIIDGVEVECNCHDQLQRYKHYLNAGIGATYQFLNWDDYTGNYNAYKTVYAWQENMEANVESGMGLFLWSQENGTGKSFMASMVLKDCVMAGYSCYMTTFQNMLAAKKNGWNDAAYDRWYRHKIDSAQVLLIDDLGKEIVDNTAFNRDFAKQTLDTLLRTRVQQCRPTLFTSNFDPSGLSQHYGQAVISLLKECVRPVNVPGDDYRPKAMFNPRVKGKRRIY